LVESYKSRIAELSAKIEAYDSIIGEFRRAHGLKYDKE
jgi:hypothetical protein